ncbi:hypothetical protein THAOC_00244, partial [Thalassiosira oceanica]
MKSSKISQNSRQRPFYRSPRRQGRAMDHQRAGDAPRSGGRSPAIAADGPSPAEDAATDAADGAPSPRRPLRERSPGTANKQSAETTGGAGEDDAAAKGSKRADAPPSEDRRR